MRISDWSSDVCSSDLPMFQSGCHGREYGNQGNGSEHGPCLRPTMDNSRGALRARTARLQIPGCCTVSVRSQLGRTLLPEYGKFHSSVQTWSGYLRSEERRVGKGSVDTSEHGGG